MVEFDSGCLFPLNWHLLNPSTTKLLVKLRSRLYWGKCTINQEIKIINICYKILFALLWLYNKLLTFDYVILLFLYSSSGRSPSNASPMRSRLGLLKSSFTTAQKTPTQGTPATSQSEGETWRSEVLIQVYTVTQLDLKF